MTHLIIVVQFYNTLQYSNDIGFKGSVDVETACSVEIMGTVVPIHPALQPKFEICPIPEIADAQRNHVQDIEDRTEDECRLAAHSANRTPFTNSIQAPLTEIPPIGPG
jgi:hypothetical protein